MNMSPSRRTKFTFLISLISSFAFAQNLDEGIKFYEDKEYVKAISSLDAAVAQMNLSFPEMSDAYYYRGVARMDLLNKDPENLACGFNPLVHITKDLLEAKRLRSDKAEKVDPILFKLRPKLIQEGKKTFKVAQKAKVKEFRIGQLEVSCEFYNAAYQIQRNVEIDEQLGYVYRMIADYYYATRETKNTYQKAFDRYKRALEHLDIAYEEDQLSDGINDAISAVYEKLNDGELISKVDTQKNGDK